MAAAVSIQCEGGEDVDGSPSGARASQPTGSYAYLLDIDDDLAQEFDLRMRIVARQLATVLVSTATAGDSDASRFLAGPGAGLGILVVEGVIAIDTRVVNRVATELVGAGDLLQPWEPGEDDLVERERTWTVLVPARLAHLDTDFVERIRPWPQVTEALLRRAGRRTADLNLQRAIASQPRLEVRLVLLLWYFASRWGKVESGGIRVPLPLTHRVLGHLVGAERPSVSHALSRLSEAALVMGDDDGWHLTGTLEQQLATLVDRREHSPHPVVTDIGKHARGRASHG